MSEMLCSILRTPIRKLCNQYFGNNSYFSLELFEYPHPKLKILLLNVNYFLITKFIFNF